MTETERKALALLNEVQKVRGHTGSPWNSPTILNEALYRAIEQHEAFRQEVSGALEKRGFYIDDRDLGRFIIAKTDPLVEALLETFPRANGAEGMAADLRAAIEARGGRIVWEGE